LQRWPSGRARKPFFNDYKHWQALQSASKAARWLGLVPFERIIDERNAPADIYVPDKIKLYPVALTLDQIRTLRLPSSPLKETERRASRWREMHGHDQTEIDAMVELHPETLREAVFDAIRPFYDFDLDDRVLLTEMKWRKEADKALQGHPAFKGASKRIKAAWKSLRTAERKLRSEQRQAAQTLQETVPRPPDFPEAQPDGEAEPALFDSNADFLTATQRLIRHKRLLDASRAE
jgi:hypothetical protein